MEVFTSALSPASANVALSATIAGLNDLRLQRDVRPPPRPMILALARDTVRPLGLTLGEPVKEEEEEVEELPRPKRKRAAPSRIQHRF